MVRVPGGGISGAILEAGYPEGHQGTAAIQRLPGVPAFLPSPRLFKFILLIICSTRLP